MLKRSIFIINFSQILAVERKKLGDLGRSVTCDDPTVSSVETSNLGDTGGSEKPVQPECAASTQSVQEQDVQEQDVYKKMFCPDTVMNFSND